MSQLKRQAENLPSSKPFTGSLFHSEPKAKALPLPSGFPWSGFNYLGLAHHPSLGSWRLPPESLCSCPSLGWLKLAALTSFHLCSPVTASQGLP